MSEQEQQQIIAAYQGGQSIASLAGQFRHKEGTVSKLVEKAGVKRSKRAVYDLRNAQNAPELAQVSAARWAELYWGPDKPTLAELGKQLGVSAPTIKNYLRRHAIRIRSHAEQAIVAFSKGRRRGWSLSPEQRKAAVKKAVEHHNPTALKGRRRSAEHCRAISEAKKGRIPVSCDWCKKPILIKPSRLAQSKTICCSRACAAAHQSFRLKVGLQVKGGNVTHGGSSTPLYRRWSNMRRRCENPNTDVYALYGGRGITVCPEWQEWPAFRDWAFAHGFAEGLELDRIDNDGDYEPGNCRWTTRRQQCNNTRRTLFLTAWGETKSLAEWVEDPRCPVGYGTLAGRYGKNWTAEDKIGLPSVRGRRDIRLG